MVNQLREGIEHSILYLQWQKSEREHMNSTKKNYFNKLETVVVFERKS